MPVAIEPNPANVLSAFVRVDTELPTRVAVTAHAPRHRVSVPPTATAACRHLVGLVGLRASTDYQVQVDLVGDDGSRQPAGAALTLRTGPLPDDLPMVSVWRDPRRCEGGLTLFSLTRWHRSTRLRPPRPVGPAAHPAQGYLLVVDSDGHVVWYYRTTRTVEDVRQLSDGDLLINCDYSVALRVDVLGRTVSSWAGRLATDVDAVPVDADTIHHEVTVLPNGNLLFLSTELRAVVDPALTMCEGTLLYNVIGDVVIEADPHTGRTVQRWPLMDVLDPLRRPGHRLCDGGLATAPPVRLYRARHHHPRDWSHANAVTLDQRRNALLVSLRHHDLVLAIRYRDDAGGPAGSLLWTLGRGGTFPLAAGEWFSHQHAPEVQPDGSILLYDNGVGREKPFSRAARYLIDGGRAWQTWCHVLFDRGRPVFSKRQGDANRLANGNVLITHGNLTDEHGRLYARIVEVAPEPAGGGDVVFDLRVADEDWGWCVYRAERITSLYR